jgi:CRISPR-associated protein Cmr2
MNQRFHFTFGPVQGFVAQARRTRDLWAGSWLLSYLAESAIAAAEQAGATLVLPHRPPEDRLEVTMRRGGSLFGGFPNRFTADAPDPVRAAEAASDGLHEAWRGVANAVWERYVAPAEAMGNGTRVIWDRQVESFWETAWVVGDADALAARKNVRLVDARVEPGDHCSLMGDLQELSGHYGRGSRDGRDAFWSGVRETVPTLDLEKNERLCAIALIKRLFAHVAEEAVGSRLDRVRGWPSTAWLAASPWVERVLRSTPEAAAEFVGSLDDLRWMWSYYGEREAARRRFNTDGAPDFAGIDGPLYFDSAVANPASLDNLEEGQETHTQLRLLRALYDASGTRPEPFYAVLLMDGDRMGRILGEVRDANPAGGEGTVSQALASFAAAVDGIVRRYHGYTIYAGGDDVLALLPAPGAVACAERLASAYADAFAALPLAKPATVSGGLVFAHYKAPLRTGLRHAHHLLDTVAKEATGRGALAVSTVQSSGTTATWAAPWEVVTGRQDEKVGPLRELAIHFGRDGALNPSYLYNLRERLAGLFGNAALDATGAAVLPPGFDAKLLEAIARAEYVPAANTPGGQGGAADPIDALLTLTRVWGRDDDGAVRVTPGSFDFGGIRIARFLVCMQEAAAADLRTPTGTP